MVFGFGVSMSLLVRLGPGVRVGMGFEGQCMLGIGTV